MDLKDIRNRIDRLDAEILRLFTERMDCAKEVARYKIENGLPVLNAEREREILDRVERAAGEYAGAARMVFSALMEVSRALQHNMTGAGRTLRETLERALQAPTDAGETPRIACQGVDGAYSGEAARILYPRGQIRFFERFEDVFEAVRRDEADLGVLPIENSTAGSVSEVYDLMLRHRFYINKGLNLKIRHCLLAREGTKLSDIRRVYSHPQALLQCSEYLKSLGCEPVPGTNTAAAAEFVAKGGDFAAAAVASKAAAEKYGLKILAENIQNSDTNSTRFIAVSKTLRLESDADRTGLVFSLPHVTGSLYRILARFAAVNLSLTKIESRPVAGRDFEYLFYLDFQGDVRNPRVSDLLCALSEELPDFAFLGNYPEREA